MSGVEPLDGRSRRAEAVRAQRRAQILETALLEFSQRGYEGTSVSDIVAAAGVARGYEGTSVSDIVAAAGVARGTFYQYFDSKHAIFVELLDRLLDELRDSVRGVDPAPGTASFEDQLQAILVRVFETTVANRPLTRIIFRVAVGVDAELDQKLRDFYGNLETFLEHSLRLGQAVAFVRPDVDPVITATCILGSIRQVVVAHVVESDAPFDTETVATAVLAYNLRGIT